MAEEGELGGLEQVGQICKLTTNSKPQQNKWTKVEMHLDEVRRVKLGARNDAVLLRPASLLVVLVWLASGLVPAAHLDLSIGGALAVSVQRLSVPDLVVIDQLQARQKQQQQHIDFECLVSFDKRKDKNLIVKWHHDERNEPIYQWIPELNKRSIAPQYRAFIAPIVQSNYSIASELQQQQQTDALGHNQTLQVLEAGFRLIKPSKELGGKYTCSAISSQNDDSKWKKMIVYTPPRSFKFSAALADLGALLASQRYRLIQSAVLSPLVVPQQAQQQQLPLAYRMRGALADLQPVSSTISPQLFSTIDYVNVNQQRARQLSATAQWPTGPLRPQQQQQQQQLQQAPLQRQTAPAAPKQLAGLKLVCDIDQVFPVPEVSIYRLAKLDGSHPERLPKLETKIERDPQSGLFRVQVISIVDDDELQARRSAQTAGRPSAPPDPSEPVYFECLMALTNLELSKYADNKRSIAYRPGSQAASGAQTSGSDALDLEQTNGAALASRTTESLLLSTMTVGAASAMLIMHWQLR